MNLRWLWLNPVKNKKESYKFGLLAETAAAVFLMAKGYRILARRYKTPVGEVDLIARRGKTVAFVEVKARRRGADALSSVTPWMQDRISRAAQYYISRNSSFAGCELRFDLIAFAPPFFLRHLDNAWRPST
ncbi:MAG: YraN family protein [Proteobacteria bacterium]|nr:YraN family protein [Pseudomonadota bacterium]